MHNSLSGRFLILTTIFVMLAEVLIFVPSIARFREDYLRNRLERAQIASLALLADNMLSDDLEAELLKNAGVYNVVLRRNDVRELALSSPMPPITSTTAGARETVTEPPEQGWARRTASVLVTKRDAASAKSLGEFMRLWCFRLLAHPQTACRSVD